MNAESQQLDHLASPGRQRTWLIGLCACAVPLLTYAVTWCAIGQLSVPDGWRQVDWIHPVLPRRIEVVAGTVSGILLLPALYVLFRAKRRGQLAPPWPMLVGLVTAYAAWSAYAGRVVTAEAFGANIGAGLVIFAQIPVTIAVVSVVLIHTGRAVRRRYLGRRSR